MWFVECGSHPVPAGYRRKCTGSVRPPPSGANVPRGPDRGGDLGPQHGVRQLVRRRSSPAGTDERRIRWWQPASVTGEPGRIVGPQAGIVEAGGFTKGIIAPAVSIAGEIVEALEFAKDGEVRGGAESVFEFRQGNDFVAQQVLAKNLRVEGEGDNVIVPIGLAAEGCLLGLRRLPPCQPWRK